MRISVGTTIGMFLAGVVACAQTATNVTVTPSSSIFDCKNIAGVPLDAAPGFPSGSFASTGGPATVCLSGGATTKTDMYFTPANLFAGRSVTLGDIASITYWTKKGATHIVDPRDWYLVIYTKRYAGQLGVSFYGIRVNTEPYFSVNLIDPANAWNKWTTGGPNNQLRFFESTYGYFGSYTDPNYSSLIAGTSLPGSRGPGVPYASQPILFFSLQTASTWAAGFTGQVDGLRIQLTDASVATVNFEPFLVATDKKGCLDGGWVNLRRADGSTFLNQSACIHYAKEDKFSSAEDDN